MIKVLRRTLLALFGGVILSTALVSGMSHTVGAVATPTQLSPYPLRELYTKPNQAYLYTASWSETDAARKTYGFTLSSQRPLGYAFLNNTADTVKLERFKQKSNGARIVSTYQPEIDALKKNTNFTYEGTIGSIYSAPQPGAEALLRYHNASGWRLAYQSQDAAMRSAGYTLDGQVGYLLKNYTQAGAYYFSSFDAKANPLLLTAVQNVYGRYPDPWGGVRDFSGQDPSVPQNTQGWGGDWSYLKPQIGYYDDSQPATLEQQIDQAASHGLSYFAFYNYWNNQTKTTQYDSAIKAFMAAQNTARMRFTINPCIVTYGNDPEHLALPTSQFSLAANAFADYTTKANYLTTQDGRPIMFMCDSRSIGSGSIADRNNFVTQLKNAVKTKTGRDLYVLNNSEYGLSTAQQLTGDGYTCLNIGSYITSGSYASYVANLSSYFTPLDNSGKPMMRCGMSGFNEAPRTNLLMTKDQVRYFKDDTKAQFPAAMQATANSMKNQPASPIDNYFTMYAYNEWHEGGIIEPNVRDGDYYLRTMQTTFGLPAN